MSLKKLSLALAIAIAMSVGAFAAETKVGAQWFFKYEMKNLENKSTQYAGGLFSDNMKTDRLRLVFDTKLDDVWDAKFVFNGTANGALNGVEFAWARAKIVEGVSVMFGIIPTVELATIDAPRDLRWISSPLLWRSGSSFSAYSGTIGVRGNINIAKMVTIGVMFDGGESQFNKTPGHPYAMAVDVGINVMDNLRIGLFGRTKLGMDVNYGDEQFWYAGAGVSWKDKYIKFGTNWAFKSTGPEAAGSVYAGKNAWIIGELYGNINMNEIIGMPLLVIAELTMQFNQQTSDTMVNAVAGRVANGGTGIAGMDFKIGVGYAFSNNVRAAVLFGGVLDKDMPLGAGGAYTDALNANITLASEVKF